MGSVPDNVIPKTLKRYQWLPWLVQHYSVSTGKLTNVLPDLIKEYFQYKGVTHDNKGGAWVFVIHVCKKGIFVLVFSVLFKPDNSMVKAFPADLRLKRNCKEYKYFIVSHDFSRKFSRIRNTINCRMSRQILFFVVSCRH